MDILKIAMIGMAGVCLAIPLKSYKAEYGMLISLGTCVCIFIYLVTKLEIVVEYIGRIETVLNLDGGYIRLMLKMMGITYVAQFAAEICKDAGYGAVGQTVDVESENTCDMTKEKLDFIYRLKTSALIEASMMIGAVLAGATGSEQKIVEEVASKVGLAFQIQDDILDVTSTMEVLGKPIGSDEKNHKSTYVTYEGIEKAKQDVADLSEKAIAQMETLVVKNEFLTELLRYLISREK